MTYKQLAEFISHKFSPSQLAEQATVFDDTRQQYSDVFSISSQQDGKTKTVLVINDSDSKPSKKGAKV